MPMLALRPLGSAEADDEFSRFASALLAGGVAEESRDALRALARHVALACGEAAPLRGKREHHVFVASGATKLVASASHGREQIVAFHFAGDIVPVPAAAAHIYTLTALVPTTALVFPSAELLAVAGSEPALAGALLARSMQALGRCREKSITLGRKTAQERLTGFLLTMGERIGTARGTGVAVQLPMSRRDIADSLGLTIETVSRQFGELRQAGLIETEGRSGVRLLDIAPLDACCGHLRDIGPENAQFEMDQ